MLFGCHASCGDCKFEKYICYILMKCLYLYVVLLTFFIKITFLANNLKFNLNLSNDKMFKCFDSVNLKICKPFLVLLHARHFFLFKIFKVCCNINYKLIYNFIVTVDSITEIN